MLGFRNTLIFYTFKDQQAILQLTIANQDETFPVTAKIHLFDKATTGEGLKKWINNQHSDGLFPDIPKPTFTGELPKGACKVTSHKQTGSSENPGPRKGTFKDFTVDLSIKAHRVDRQFNLSAFADTARVHVHDSAGPGSPKAPDEGKDARQDAERILGTWKLKSLEDKGSKSPGEALTDRRWVITKEKLSMHTPAGLRDMPYKLDPTKSPKWIELGEGQTRAKAIYELEGDLLKVCMSENPQAGRPSALESKPNSVNAKLFVLKREKLPARPEPDRAE